MAEPVPVLITAIGGAGHGEQILKALRLAETPYRLIGADANAYCPQFRLVDQALTLPRADAPGYIDAVLSVCAHFGVRAAFHGSEPELMAMNAARDRFAAANILLPINPDPVIRACMDKQATVALLRDLGFDPPRSLLIQRSQDLPAIDFYPAVIKPHLGSGGSKDCYIVQDAREMALLAEYIGYDRGIFVQEYVGTPESEFTVGVLTDLDGVFINSIAVRRELKSQLNLRVVTPNRTGRTDLGSRLVISSGVSHGEVGPFPAVTGPCEAIAKAIGARGAINIQCRLVGDQVKVFEINPRFSGTTSIRAMMGYNEPDILIRRHVLGETITPRFPYRSGMVLRSLIESEVPTEAAPSWNAFAPMAGEPGR